MRMESRGGGGEREEIRGFFRSSGILLIFGSRGCRDFSRIFW